MHVTKSYDMIGFYDVIAVYLDRLPSQLRSILLTSSKMFIEIFDIERSWAIIVVRRVFDLISVAKEI